MCTHSSGGSYTAPKVDPAPTTVQSSDVGTEKEATTQRRKRGHSSTELSTDRQSILGNLINSSGRNTLG